MKNYIKGFGIIVALLYSMTALAGGTVKVNGKEVGTAATGLDNDGNAASASIDVGSGKCTLTITPGYGKYITVNDISAIKTIDGSNAQTRTPGINTPVTITATDDTADPSGTTSYTFDVPTTNEYDYEVTATFQNRTSVDGATVEVVGGPYTYSGSAIKPDLKVTVGGVTLTKDTDYKAYYKDSINAGTNTGKVIIEGIRKYNGSRGDWDNPAATYTIEKAEITPVVTITGWTYGSPANAPEVKEGNPGKGEVSYKYKVTSEGDDTYSAEVPTAANNYTVKATVAETPNYKEGTAIKTFTISPKTIAGATITLTPESFTYNGQNQKPTVSVKDGNTDLVLDTDYTLTNDGGTNVGEYNVTITGKGNYDSKTTATKKFNITVLEKTPTVALANPDEAIVYDGTAKEPALTVSVVIKDGDAPTALTLNTDYTVVYSDNVNAGTNTAKATVTLKGNYKGTGSATFTIAPKSIGNVNISDIADQAYTGSAIQPTVTVKDGDKTLEKDKDYTISYSNNTAAAASTAEKAPTVIVTGKGNYDPNTTATKKFTITPKSIANATITLDHENFVYNGQNQKPTVSVKDGNTDLVLDTDYTLTNEGGTNAGEYTITITGKGNYDSKTTATKKFNITVLEKTPTVALANPDEAIVYDGNAKEPAITVSVVIKDGDEPTVLTLNTDYTVAYSDNVNAGTNTAKATVTLKGNYKGTGSGTFTIAPKSIANVTISDIADQAYTGSAIQPTVTVKDGDKTLVFNTDYTVSYSYNTAAAASTAENAPTVIVTGKGNYDPNTKAKKTFTIGAKSIANATITLDHESFVYNGQNQKPTVSVKDGDTDLVLDTDYTITNDGGTNVGEYTVTITGKGNYDVNTTATKKYYITVATMTVTAEGYEGTYDRAAHSIKVNAPDGATIKYGTQAGTYDLTTNPTYTDAGTHTVYYSVSMVNYADVTGSKDVVIKPKSIANVSISDIADQAYTGSAIEPTVTVKDGEKTLEKDKDYTLSYSNNTAAAASSAENAPTVIVTGKGNYDANTKATKTFTIMSTTISLTYSSDKAEAKMGEAFTAPTLNNPNNVTVTYSSSNTDVATISEEGMVTLKGPGKTTITASFAGNERYEAASASYELTVDKYQNAGLSWTDEGMEYFLGDPWYGPRLNNPNNLKVTYKSNEKDVATIDENGKVTALSVGETWIKAIFEGNEMYEPQTVKYLLMVRERYDLLVNDIRVTSDNCGNVLGDGHFFYDENTKLLVVTSNENPVTIESRLKNLTIFLNGSSKLERIFFNNEGNEQNTGSLTITTYDNIPGKVVLETTNANGVISGFSGLTIDKKSLTYLLDPVDGKYQGGKLVTAEGAVAMTATIGQYLKPLVDGQTVTFPPGKFAIDDFTNKVIEDILFTMVLRADGSDEDDDYYDPVESAIVLNNLNSTNGVTMLIDNVEKGELIPGSNEYALQFKGGITFMVPSGEGTITLNLKTEPGYKLMLMIGKDTPREITQNERGDVQFTYDVKEATYCCIYLVQSAGTRGTRIGKRDRHHGSIYSIKVEPTKVRNMNPLSEVEGFPTYQKPEVVVHSSTGIKEIKVETTYETSGDDSWYDMQGRKIDKPTKAGIYIQNRKKIVIR